MEYLLLLIFPAFILFWIILYAKEHTAKETLITIGGYFLLFLILLSIALLIAGLHSAAILIFFCAVGLSKLLKLW